MDKDTIKVADYLPYYGFFYLDYPGKVNAFLYVKGEFIPFDKLYDNYSELELHPLELVILDREDYNGFVYYLSQLKTEAEVIAAFRESFDSYRVDGGDPLEWLDITFDDVEKNYSNYPTIYRGAIQKNLLEWFNVYNEITPFEPLEDEQQATTQTRKTEPPKETPADKIKRILKEGLTGLFEDDKHIDTIASGLIEYHKENECTIEPIRLFATYTDINEFYEPFVKVWKETGLTPANIGEVLTRFVFMHNGKREGIAPGTVRKNIYECSKKLEHRNRP